MYQVVSDTVIKRLTDDAFIPVDKSNLDYINYLIWVGEGNKPSPAPSVAKVIPSVSPLQARRALLEIGLLDEADAFVGTLDRFEQLAWEYATLIERDNPIITKAAAAIGLTEAQVDALFARAAEL